MNGLEIKYSAKLFLKYKVGENLKLESSCCVFVTFFSVTIVVCLHNFLFAYLQLFSSAVIRQ